MQAHRPVCCVQVQAELALAGGAAQLWIYKWEAAALVQLEADAAAEAAAPAAGDVDGG